MQGVRLLLAARLSQPLPGQTGIDTQDQDARSWAEARGHEIVGVAADKISGRKAPWERPNLKPWMSEPEKLIKFDGIVAAKQDRLSRAKWRDESEIRRWAEDHHKQLFIVSPELHWPPANMAEQIAWDVLAAQAAQEWENISSRYRRMQKWLHDKEYLVGKAPFGYRIVELDDHKTLAPDPITGPIVRELVERYLDGETLLGLCAWLDTKVKPPNGAAHWGKTSVSRILDNPVLIGRRVNAEGRTELKVPPLIELTTWRKLQERRTARSTTRTRKAAAMLSGSAFCEPCGAPLYRQLDVNGRYFYRCANRSVHSNMIKGPELEAWVDEQMTSEPLCSKEDLDMVVIPGSGHDDARKQIDLDIRDLDPDDPEYDEKHAALRAERKRLASLPAQRSDEVTFRPTGWKVGELWLTFDQQQKRKYLLDHHAAIYVEHLPKDQADEASPYPRLRASIDLTA